MSTGAPQLGHFSSVLLFDADLTNDNLYFIFILDLSVPRVTSPVASFIT